MAQTDRGFRALVYGQAARHVLHPWAKQRSIWGTKLAKNQINPNCPAPGARRSPPLPKLPNPYPGEQAKRFGGVRGWQERCT